MSDDESERSGSPAEPETRDAAAAADDSTPGDDSVNAGPPTDPDGQATADDEDAPLSDLARRVSERRQKSPDERGSQPDSGRRDPRGETVETGLSDDGPPPDADDDPFDQMSVGEIDEETLWSSLEGDTESGPTVGMAGDAEPVSEARSETVEYVVSKDTYCQSCPYLDEPPELACTHEGTEIVEVVDTDHFRVRNCPMIDE